MGANHIFLVIVSNNQWCHLIPFAAEGQKDFLYFYLNFFEHSYTLCSTHTFVNRGHLEIFLLLPDSKIWQDVAICSKCHVRILRDKKWLISFSFTFCKMGILHEVYGDCPNRGCYNLNISLVKHILTSRKKISTIDFV